MMYVQDFDVRRIMNDAVAAQFAPNTAFAKRTYDDTTKRRHVYMGQFRCALVYVGGKYACGTK